jgi:hypothetical protein
MTLDPYSEEVLKELIGRVLGPTADFLGHELETFIKYRFKNLKQILEAADRKRRPGSNTSQGVHPRIARDALENGTLSSDALWADYFGGVLASSSSKDASDDRGAVYTALIGRLSRFDLRLHCVLYLGMQRLAASQLENSHPTRIELGWAAESSWETIVKKLNINASPIFEAMNFSVEEVSSADQIIRESFACLARESLIANEYYVVSEKGYRTNEDTPSIWHVSGPSYVFSASDLGVNLFMWALGLGAFERNEFLSLNLSDQLPKGVPVLEGIEPIWERSRSAEFVSALRYSH